MSRFDVELLGGPLAGRRSLQTPRHEPPLQIPVVHGDERGGVVIYRYRSREEDGHYVYTFAGERRRAG